MIIVHVLQDRMKQWGPSRAMQKSLIRQANHSQKRTRLCKEISDQVLKVVWEFTLNSEGQVLAIKMLWWYTLATGDWSIDLLTSSFVCLVFRKVYHIRPTFCLLAMWVPWWPLAITSVGQIWFYSAALWEKSLQQMRAACCSLDLIIVILSRNLIRL